MGILPSSPKVQEKTPVSTGKRRSIQADFAKIKPLNPNGLKGFSNFRDPAEDAGAVGSSLTKAAKKRLNDPDSDDEDAETGKELLIKTEGDDVLDPNGILSPEDAKRQAELAQGVQKIRVRA